MVSKKELVKTYGVELKDTLDLRSSDLRHLMVPFTGTLWKKLEKALS